MILLSTAYLAPIEYFATLSQNQQCAIDNEEHYIKQTYRNRCIIATAHGILALSIPVIKKNGNHTKVKDIAISYAENWQQIHWRAIVSAYSNSPFFLYYQDELEGFYMKRYDSLADFNFALTQVLLDILEIPSSIKQTTTYIESNESGVMDFRNSIHPKTQSQVKFKEYTQVFGDRHNFIPNLSILDLLFNVGPESYKYLRNIIL